MSLLNRALISITLLLAMSLGLHGQSLEQVLARVPDEYARPRQKIEKMVGKYRGDAARSKQRAVKKLDSRLTRLRRGNGGPLVATQISQITDIKDWLNSGGEVPNSEIALQVIVPYAEALEKKRDVITKPLNSLMNLLNRNGKQKLTLDLERAFDDLGGEMNARSAVEPGNNFAGYRTSLNGANAIRIGMRFEKLRGREFSGRVERDLGISHHPVHSMSGHFHGMKLVANTGPTIAFGNKRDGNWTYSGFVIGDNIIGRYHGKTKRGRPGQGFFHLKRR